jgi:hypothetical protein
MSIHSFPCISLFPESSQVSVLAYYSFHPPSATAKDPPNRANGATSYQPGAAPQVSHPIEKSFLLQTLKGWHVIAWDEAGQAQPQEKPHPSPRALKARHIDKIRKQLPLIPLENTQQ